MMSGEVCAVKILGIGTDMISIDRIKKSLSKAIHLKTGYSHRTK